MQISFNWNTSGKTKLIWSCLCMSSPSPLHWRATQRFDERYKRKQSESFLRQPEHTIWVSRHRTLRTQYLHLGLFLWKQYIILASYKDFGKLQSFWFMYSFTTWLFRYLDLFWIWCCFQFLLHCLVQPNQAFTFSFISFLSQDLDSESFKQSTCTLYASEILFFKVFINACKLTGEMPIDWSFFLGVWHSVNSLSVSVTDWNLSWSSVQWVCL